MSIKDKTFMARLHDWHSNVVVGGAAETYCAFAGETTRAAAEVRGVVIHPVQVCVVVQSGGAQCVRNDSAVTVNVQERIASTRWTLAKETK